MAEAPAAGGSPAGQDCCWYHRMPWPEATQAAIEALDAVAVNVDPWDQAEAAREVLARETDRSPDALTAADALLRDPVQFYDREPDRYINGQHRCYAMIEQAVPAVPAMVDLPVGQPEPHDLRCLGTAADVDVCDLRTAAAPGSHRSWLPRWLSRPNR